MEVKKKINLLEKISDATLILSFVGLISLGYGHHIKDTCSAKRNIIEYRSCMVKARKYGFGGGLFALMSALGSVASHNKKEEVYKTLLKPQEA